LVEEVESMDAIRKFLLTAGIVLVSASVADAWMRLHHEDVIVVERSELIVVGHLRPESIQYVPHKKAPGDGASWEHHATLVISEVLKGKSEKAEIPLIIHYGLDPLVGDSSMADVRSGAKHNATDKVEIRDTGNSAMGGGPLVEDAGKDNLWFLRRLSGIYGREPGTGDFGIADPEDLQPLALKEYFVAYLKEKPEEAVKKAMEGLPTVRKRGQDYLDHMEIQRISKVEDIAARVPRLMPYLTHGWGWGERDAEAALIACVKAAGPALLKGLDTPEYQKVRPILIRLLAKTGYEPAGPRLAEVFDAPAFKDCRQAIIDLWGEIRYKEAAGILVKLLEEQDKFWEKQKLEKGWWNNAVETDLTKERRERYCEVYYSVNALHRIGVAAARKAIEQTRQRWEAINIENPQIVEACDAALNDLPKE